MDQRRVAIITGGSSGIGLEAGRQLVDAGYDVVLTARREGPLEDAAERIAGLCFARARVALEQGCGGRQHTRRADTALGRTSRPEGVLKRPPLGGVRRQAFHGDD